MKHADKLVEIWIDQTKRRFISDLHQGQEDHVVMDAFAEVIEGIPFAGKRIGQRELETLMQTSPQQVSCQWYRES